MAIRIEFYGIPRQRAGVTETTVEGRSLGEVLMELERRYPGLSPTCLDGGQLQAGFTANLDGDHFLTDPATELSDDDVVLILSADAGG